MFHFYVNIELRTAFAMEPAAKMPMLENNTAEKKHTILVAEDIDSNFALVDIILRKDFKVVRAYNGAEAVQLFKDLHPSLILMDIQMPEMNGLEATKIIRVMDEKIPIIALTAFAFQTDKMEFMDAGGSDYVVKPIDPMQLRAQIKSILD